MSTFAITLTDRDWTYSLVALTKAFRDGETNTKRMVENKRRRRANTLSGKDWLRRSFSIWRNLPRNSEERNLRHPAVFPVALAKRIIETYTDLVDVTVLDPFAGTGSTLIASLECGANAIGLDINRNYKRVFSARSQDVLFPTKQNVKVEYHVCDARDILSKVGVDTIDICFTSPPYWDILNSKRTADGRNSQNYSENDDDLGNIDDYNIYLSELIEILEKVSETLKPKAYLIVNVMDLRKGPIFFPLHSDLINRFNKGDLLLDDIIIWDRQSEYNSMRPLGYPYKFIINKVHEYLLVYRKRE